MSKVAAQKYVADELHRPAPPPVSIDCDAPRFNGAYRCRVRFQVTSLLPGVWQPPESVKVFVFPEKIVVTAEPFVSLDGTPTEPLCTYDYSCADKNRLVLTLRDCKRGKAPAPKP